MPPIRDDALGSSLSIKGRIRGMFIQKPKPPTAPRLSAISMPSRISTKKKRNFNEVADDDQDRGSAINPRAGTRQRLEMHPTNHPVPMKSVSRKSSNDSLRTIREPRMRRAPSSSTIVLDPGRSAPAKAVLTRSTSHNQTVVPTPVDQQATIHLPSKKRSPLSPYKSNIVQSKTITPKTASTSPTFPPKVPGLKRSRSNASLSTSLPKKRLTPTSGRENPGSFAAAMAAPIPHARGSHKVEVHSPEDAMLKQVLEFVVHEDDDDDKLDALLASSVSRDVTRNSNLASMMSVDENGREYTISNVPPVVSSSPPLSKRLSARSRLDRFDVKVQPCQKHTAIWDLESSDVYAWPALLCITDKERHHTGFETRLPVQNIELEFHSIGDPQVSGPSSPIVVRQSLPIYEYTTHYDGTFIPHGIGAPRLIESDGICVTKAWNVGPFHNSTAASEKYGAESPVNASYFLKFYVPIPVRLFEGREYRKFNVKSKVVFGAWDLDPVVAHSGTVQVTIEHLRKEVHMDGRKPLSVSPARN